MFNESNSNHGWLMIIYRMPTTPSTSRVTVWKKVKELGAYLLQQSVYVLPNIPEVGESVGRLKELIAHLGGESKIIQIASLGDDQEKEVIAGLNKSREEEYTEVVKACEELLHEIDEESKAQDFHFADLEENEKHLQRVIEHLEAVRNRDYFGSPLRAMAVELIDECQKKFESFSQEVFSREAIMNEDRRLDAETGSGHREEFALPMAALSSRVQSIMSDLERGALHVDKKTVGNLPESIMLKLEFREHKNERRLLLAVSWSVPQGRKDRP
jgi:vacuolar-type H+-ATPase subunit I/STV1